MSIWKRTLAASLVLAALPLAAAGSETRLRVENANREGRVEVVLSDESVRTVEVNIPGVVSGESLTVEAPAPHVILGGGSITGDPLLEAMVDEKVRNSTRRAPTILVLPAPPRHRTVSMSSYRYINHVFTDVGLAYWPAYTPVYRPAARQHNQRSHRQVATRQSRPSRPTGGVYATRAMMPSR